MAFIKRSVKFYINICIKSQSMCTTSQRELRRLVTNRRRFCKCSKSEKNVVVLWDWDSFFKDVADDIKRVIKDKKVVSYPSAQTKQEGISNVKDFAEKNDHILVTQSHYFNGCEAANAILLNQGSNGVRNYLLRGVQNIICVQLTDAGTHPNIHGMKIDNRFRPVVLNKYHVRGLQ